MDKPNILRDLLAAGHISLTDVRNVAREIFDGKTTAAGPGQGGLEGYVLTASQFDDLPEHVQGFVIKAVLAFGVENVLDAEKFAHTSDEQDAQADGRAAEQGATDAAEEFDDDDDPWGLDEAG